MKKTFLVILISVFAFIGVNTIFYFTIYNQQLDFQTGLLTRQTRICGSTFEQSGSQFENELNYIPFADDFSRLFTDEGIRERGAENLERLYSRYSELIRNVTVYDYHNNVYSLILDQNNNFVSDYYESQFQPNLLERDQLVTEGDRYMLNVPDFDDEGIVRSNILVELDYRRYVNAVFDQYLLEGTTWPWLVTSDGEVVASAAKDISVTQGDLEKIVAEIIDENEGWMVHSILTDSLPARVVSVYYPLRFIKRDFAVVFSMKTDIFLRTIIVKFVIITICSLVLLGLLLYVHFRVIKVRTGMHLARRISEESLRRTMDALPLGLILADPAGGIRMMNLKARELLMKDPSEAYPQLQVADLGFESLAGDHSLYRRFLGDGEMVRVRNEKQIIFLFKRDWTIQIGDADTRIILLFNISALQKSIKLDQVTMLAKNDLIDLMKEEIDLPARQIREALTRLKGSNLTEEQEEIVISIQKSRDLLDNLINVITDVAGQDASEVILERIPFSLHTEVNMALDPFKALAAQNESSLITKIRSDVPDHVIGDPFRLRKVISGLVDTAVEQTRDGRILLSTELIDKNPEHVTVRFHVEDTGRGLDVVEIEKYLSGPGSSKDNIPEEIEKTVLRLAVARQQIELMNGYLWIESPSSISTDPANPGTRFSFTVEVREESPPGKCFEEVGKYADIHCLILAQQKDTPGAGRFKPLSDLGIDLKYLIYRPDNMDSVADLVRQRSANTHLLILIDSAGENGYDLARNLNDSGIGKDLVRILFSSRQEPEYGENWDEAGIDYLIGEPFEPDTLAEIISKHFPFIHGRDAGKVPGSGGLDPGLSILLAEDNLFNGKVAQALFKSIGFEIDLVRNGQEVLEMIGLKEYDIVFMDLLMPEMDGTEATAAIRKKGLDLPVIALTAVEDEKTHRAAVEAGINDFIIKPATAGKVKEILLRYFSRNS